MKVICYRCGGGENPENTILAIEHCQRVNPDWLIEMDLQLTKDGEVILFHDSNTLRVTGVDARVEDLTLKEMRALNVGYNFQREGQWPYRNLPLRVPTLQEVFARFPEADFVLDIHTSNLDIVNKVMAIAKAHECQKLVIVSGHDKVINVLKKKKTGWKYGAATKEAKRIIYSSFIGLDNFFPLQSDYLMIPYTFGKIQVLTSRVVRHVKKRGKSIWVWMHEGDTVRTVENSEQLQELRSLGVDAVFTDFPARLFRELGT